jgi:hypothetical protein
LGESGGVPWSIRNVDVGGGKAGEMLPASRLPPQLPPPGVAGVPGALPIRLREQRYGVVARAANSSGEAGPPEAARVGDREGGAAAGGGGSCPIGGGSWKPAAAAAAAAALPRGLRTPPMVASRAAAVAAAGGVADGAWSGQKGSGDPAPHEDAAPHADGSVQMRRERARPGDGGFTSQAPPAAVPATAAREWGRGHSPGMGGAPSGVRGR